MASDGYEAPSTGAMDQRWMVPATVCAQVLITLREHYDMDKDEAKHLTHNYGTRALQVSACH